MFNTENWLISGGCGFIGVNLINHILKNNSDANIRVIDNLTEGTPKALREVCDFREITANDLRVPPHAVELVVGDIRDFELCSLACQGIDRVVHLAANAGVAPSVDNPRLDMDINVVGTFNMLEACRFKGGDRFIFASSGAPLGDVRASS